MNITAETCQILRDEVNQALTALGDKYGFSISAGRAKYTSTNVTFQLECAVINDDGVAQTKAVSNLHLYLPSMGITDEQAKKSFIMDGYSYTLAGYKPSAPMRPVIIERHDGKRFVTTINSVKRCMNIV